MIFDQKEFGQITYMLMKEKKSHNSMITWKNAFGIDSRYLNSIMFAMIMHRHIESNYKGSPALHPTHRRYTTFVNTNDYH
jgi:hypothetical protein